jgi:uncharacterized protein (DUF362 family)
MRHKMIRYQARTRRQFLRTVSFFFAGAMVSACQPAIVPGQTSSPADLKTPSPLPSAAPTSVVAQATSTAAAPTPSPLPSDVPVAATSSASEPWKPLAQVAIVQQTVYERKSVRKAMEKLLGDLWQWKDILPTGAKVAIKVNLTGGVNAYQMAGVPATESVVTHPEVVRALGELLLDAGASHIFIVESVYEWQSYTRWGYEEIAKSLNATLIDLNKPDPYPDFATVPVPNHLIYESFKLNRILTEVDTFVSVAKMKCHIECGVTNSMKNLVGLVPCNFYRTYADDGSRTGFHVDSKRRLPRIVVDLNMARPIHLAVIDGIKTIEAGEGTWAEGAKQVSPGLLLAGKNALATDTVATAVMGFDPTARYPDVPFTHADNYLHIGSTLGLGANLLETIDVRGPAIETVRYPFRPASGYKS